MPKSSDDLAYVTPSVLRWARKRIGFTQDFVGSKMGVSAEEVAAWEHDTHPPFAKAQKLATLFRIRATRRRSRFRRSVRL